MCESFQNLSLIQDFESESQSQNWKRQTIKASLVYVLIILGLLILKLEIIHILQIYCKFKSCSSKVKDFRYFHISPKPSIMLSCCNTKGS